MKPTPTESRLRSHKYLILFAAAMCCSIVIVPRLSGGSGSGRAAKTGEADGSGSARQEQADNGARHGRANNRGSYDERFQKELDSLIADLSSPDWQVRHDALAQMADFLKSLPQDEAIRLSVNLLKSGMDVEIPGKKFGVGQGAQLIENPSLRVFFMDQLGQLCREGNRDEAKQIALEVLKEKKSADEWAISLRNIAWCDKDASREFIGQKSLEMLRYEDWQKQPSGGFFEAMDGLVYGRQLDAVKDFNRFLDLGNENPLRAAGMVGFSRMADEFPVDLAKRINDAPELLSEQSDVRAEVFAKMNVTSPDQVAQLEAYLSREDILPEEKAKAVKGLLCPKLYKFFGLLNDPTPITESQQGAAQRWDNIQSLVNKWEQNDQFGELVGAFDEVNNSVAIGKADDDIARVRDQYTADYMKKHPGTEMADVPPLVFTNTDPVDPTPPSNPMPMKPGGDLMTPGK